MSLIDSLLEAELTPEQKRRAEENARKRGVKAGAFDYLNAAKPKDKRTKASPSISEHFHETLTPPSPPKPKVKAPPKVKHARLHGLTDKALRARLKSDSGSSASERQAAAALLQSRRDKSDRLAARTAPAPQPAAGAAAPAQAAEVIAAVVEAFASAAPAVTVAQSNAAGAKQVAAAKTALAAGWDAQKHPRAGGGKFGYSTGGKRSTRSVSTSGSREAIDRRLSYERGVLKTLQAGLPAHPTPAQLSAVDRAKSTVSSLEKAASTERLRKRAPAAAAPVNMAGGVVIR